MCQLFHRWEKSWKVRASCKAEISEEKSVHNKSLGKSILDLRWFLDSIKKPRGNPCVHPEERWLRDLGTGDIAVDVCMHTFISCTVITVQPLKWFGILATTCKLCASLDLPKLTTVMKARRSLKMDCCNPFLLFYYAEGCAAFCCQLVWLGC